METRKAKICVPVCVRRFADLPQAMAQAGEVGDLIEVRLDYLSAGELEERKWEIPELLRAQKRPVILTLRPAESGGARPISLSDRVLFRRDHPDGTKWDGFQFWDVEADFAQFMRREGEGWSDSQFGGTCSWEKAIVSYHHFDPVPAPEMEAIFERLRQMPAAVVKIAVQADDATDCLPVFDLLERARQADRKLIAIAMGEAGVMTRILGPSRGSFLTYGSLDQDSATAPGQLTARELREVYRIDHIDAETEVMGIIGRPVTHSISPHLHNAAFERANLNAVFVPFEVRDLDAFLRRMVKPGSREIEWNLRGLSVTAPHKSEVIKHLAWISPAAEQIGAVNTIVVQGGKLEGHNTDAAGFIEPLKRHFEALAGARCAVIGAGGAARAVVWALRNEGAAITVFARTAEKAKIFARDFGVECRPLSELGSVDYDIVINATPVGTRGPTQAGTIASASQLRGVRLAYDLVYNPIETQFLREARAAGCETVGGLEMLIGQAIEQFTLWTGRAPSDDAMHSAALLALK